MTPSMIGNYPKWKLQAEQLVAIVKDPKELREKADKISKLIVI